MVLRWLLPNQGGGGQFRRYLRVRKAVLSRILQNDDRYPCPPVSLFDFSSCRDDAVDAAKVQVPDRDAWRLSDDRVIGGFSESVATFIGSPDEYRKYMNGEEFTSHVLLNNNDNKNSSDNADMNKEEENDEEENQNQEEQKHPTQDNNHNNKFIPFLRWTGNLDTTVGLRSTVQRSGFAALRSPQFPLEGANLQGLFQALEIVCRSDGRLYTVNLKVATSIPDDIYQGHIQASPPPQSLLSSSKRAGKEHNALAADDENGNLTGDFQTFVLPFSDFRLTSMGRQREVYRELDDNVCIESVGFALMDGKNGGFQFDLARIRAVNLWEGSVFEKAPEKTM